MEGHLSRSVFTCKSCKKPDSSEAHMIVCDQCLQWEHFDCAGMTDSPQRRPFVCLQCRRQEMAGSTISSRLRSHVKRVTSTKGSVSKPPSNVASKKSSVASSVRSSVVKAQLDLIDEEARMKQVELDEEEALKKLEHEEAKRQLEEKKKQLDEQKKLADEEAILRQRQLEAEKIRLLKQQSIRRESLEKKNEIVLQISERGSVVESTTNSREKVSNWLNNLSIGTTGRKALGNYNEPQSEMVPSAPKEVPALIIEAPIGCASTTRPPKPLQCQEVRNIQRSSRIEMGVAPNIIVGSQEIRSSTIREPFQPRVSFSKPVPAIVYTCPPRGNERIQSRQLYHQEEPFRSATYQCTDSRNEQPEVYHSLEPRFVQHDRLPEHAQLVNSPNVEPPVRASLVANPAEQNEIAGVLSSQQIAARQVVGKDLPHFSGNPADWPLFISSFEQSTLSCGYSNAENLVRLQRCLTGHAREAVRSRLLLPANVQQVIGTHRTLYGRPELLIRSLHEKIRRTPGPRYDRPESILEFGLAVQNFVDHLEAARQQEHLANPMLMQELVEKLPGPMRMDWATFKGQQSRATVSTFGEFMSKLVSAASEVSFELPGQLRGHIDSQPRLREKARIQATSSFKREPPAQGNGSK